MGSLGKITAIMLILMMVMSSCSVIDVVTDFGKDAAGYGSDVVDMKKESEIIKKQYQGIYDLVDSKLDSFTDEEVAELDNIHFAFTESARRVGNMMDNPEELVTPDELKQMYELAYIGYVNARIIIIKHKDAFTTPQWDAMEQFNVEAIKYDKTVRKVLDNPDTEDINMTLGVIITISGAAYKYLLPVVMNMI